MVVMLMEVALLWNLRKGLQEVAVTVIVTTVVAVTVTVTTVVVVAALVIFLAEVLLLLQDQGVASIVDLTAIGHGTAKPVTGRTNAIVVENVAI